MAATLQEIKEARAVVAELAVANPALLPVFERLDREYVAARQDRESPVALIARRNMEIRALI